MGITLLFLLEMTRASVLGGGLCRGETINPMPPTCLRVNGGATCTLPGNAKIEADTIYIQWLEKSPTFSVTAKGKARINRGQESFSADDARVVIVGAETSPMLSRAEFAFRPAGLSDPVCE